MSSAVLAKGTATLTFEVTKTTTKNAVISPHHMHWIAKLKREEVEKIYLHDHKTTQVIEKLVVQFELDSLNTQRLSMIKVDTNDCVWRPVVVEAKTKSEMNYHAFDLYEEARGSREQQTSMKYTASLLETSKEIILSVAPNSH